MILYFFLCIHTFRTFIYLAIRSERKSLEEIKEMNNIELCGSHSNFVFQPMFTLAPWQVKYVFSPHLIPLLICMDMFNTSLHFSDILRFVLHTSLQI